MGNQVCGLVIKKWSSDEEFTSPNYPNNYPHNTNITWDFINSDGIWAIDFREFNLETSTKCVDDFLEIDDLVDSKKKPIRLCGDELPETFYSQGRLVRIRFKTDDIIEKRGFWLRVLHGADKETLQEKISHYHGNGSVHAGYKDVEEGPHGIHHYVWQGLVTALIVCCCLLVFLGMWIAISLRRRHMKTKISNYGNLAKLSNLPEGHNALGIVVNSGRKYSKCATANGGADEEETICKTTGNDACVTVLDDDACNAYIDLKKEDGSQKRQASCGN
ncbi:hypothetical protein ScPMuIL_017159 [Solemya velum]